MKAAALLGLAAGLALCAPSARAQARSGAAFLRIDGWARPAAMGGAFTAAADDASALVYNPAGLSRVARPALGATHAAWLLDSSFSSLAYALPTSAGAFGVGVTRLSAGRFQGRTADRRAAEDFSASDTAYAIGYSRPLGAADASTRAGASAKLIQSRIGSDSASTTAFDIGLQHRVTGTPLALGLSVLNLGPGARFLDQTDPLPLAFAAGAAYSLGGFLHLSADIHREPRDNRSELALGTEYSLLPAVALRAGYAAGLAGSLSGAPLEGFGGGIGVQLRRYRVDYAFTPFGALGTVQRLSFNVGF